MSYKDNITAGPWKWKFDSLLGNYRLINQEGRPCESEGDKNLQAASPELLEAAEELVKFVDDYMKPLPMCNRDAWAIKEKTKNAIRKARGWMMSYKEDETIHDEAMKVFRETGKTPRELSDEIAERKAQFIAHKADSDTIIHDYKIENQRLRQERDEALGALRDIASVQKDQHNDDPEYWMSKSVTRANEAIAKIEGEQT